MTPLVNCFVSWIRNWLWCVLPSGWRRRASVWLTSLCCGLTIFPVFKNVWIWLASLLWWKGSGTGWGLIGPGFLVRGIRCVSNSAKLSPLQELITAAPEANAESLQETTLANTLQVASSTHSVSDSAPEGALMRVETKSHSTSIPLVTIVLCVSVLCLFGSMIVYVLRTVKQRRLDGRSIISHAAAVPNYGTICGVCYDTRFSFDWVNANTGGWLGEPEFRRLVGWTRFLFFRADDSPIITYDDLSTQII